MMAAACGGGSSPQDYYGALADETAVYAEAIDELQQLYGEELVDELASLQEASDFSDTAAVDAYFKQAKEVAIVKTAELFTDLGGELRTLLDALRAMDPPQGLVPSHNDAVTTGEALAAALPVTISAVRSLETIAQLQETIEASPFNDAAQRFAIACQNLEDTGTGAGIEVDLQCPDGLDRDAG